MDHGRLACGFDAAAHTLFLTGQADESEAEYLRAALAEASDGYSRNLTVDLTACDFLPSINIGVLVGAMLRASENGTEIELVSAAHSIAERVLAICGVPHSVRGSSAVVAPGSG